MIIGISIAAAAATPLAIARAESAATTATRLQRYGAGPGGRDNETKKLCTGTRRTGPQVLCVRAGARGTGTAAAPMGTIGAAIAAARDGDIVQVAGGNGVRYSESVRVGNFGPGDCDNAGVAGRNFSFLGGFRADFTSRDAVADPTLVTGDGNAPAFVLCVMGHYAPSSRPGALSAPWCRLIDVARIEHAAWCACPVLRDDSVEGVETEMTVDGKRL